MWEQNYILNNLEMNPKLQNRHKIGPGVIYRVHELGFGIHYRVCESVPGVFILENVKTSLLTSPKRHRLDKNVVLCYFHV